MPWLDDHPECVVDPYTGLKTVGLQLLIPLNADANANKERKDNGRYWHNAVTKRLVWKSVYGLRVPVYPEGIYYLKSWPRIRKTMAFSDAMVKKNMRFLHLHQGPFQMEMDYIDHMYLQYGLDGCLWEEFPKGVPGIIIDRSRPHENLWGWVHVVVTPSCELDIPKDIQRPCKGILTW